MRARGRCVTVPHTVPLGSLRSVTDLKHQLLLIQHPRPVARQEGAQAFEDGVTRLANPYAVLTAEFASWDAGWRDASQVHS